VKTIVFFVVVVVVAFGIGVIMKKSSFVCFCYQTEIE